MILPLDFAGTSVVQVVEGTVDRHEYAAKFFLDRADFLTEAALYTTFFPSLGNACSPDIAATAERVLDRRHTDSAMPPAAPGEPSSALGQGVPFLPKVSRLCDAQTDGNAHVDPAGRPLPPCIVMEAGQSLQDWLDSRRTVDPFSALSVRRSECGVTDCDISGCTCRCMRGVDMHMHVLGHVS